MQKRRKTGQYSQKPPEMQGGKDMKSHHSISKRGLSILLSLIMAMTTLLTAFPVSAAAEEVPQDTTGDIFDGLGFNKSRPDDQNDRANTLRPYGENADMFTVNELYTLEYNSGRMEANVYGHERKTRDEWDIENIASSTGGWYTSGITANSRVEAMEGDFAGDGKPDQVALFVANPVGPVWKYTLGVSDAYHRGAGELPVTWIDISKDFSSLVLVEETDDLVNLMKIATGDINGDGRDEIVVLLPDEANSSVKAVAYSFNGARWSSGSTLISMPGSAGGVRLGTGIGNNESVAYSLAVGDLDGDGYDDVAVAASAVLYGGFNQPVNSNAACMVYMGQQGRTCDVPLTVQKSESNDVRYSGFGVGIADADGDNRNELIVGAYQVEDQPGNSNYYDLQGFIGWFYKYEGGESMELQPGGLDAAQADQNSYRPVEYSDRFVDAVAVTAAEYDGIGTTPIVFLNFAEYCVDSSTGRYVIRRGIGSVRYQSFQVRPATLEGGNSEHDDGLHTGLIVRYKDSDGTWILHQFYGTDQGRTKYPGVRLETAKPIPFALPDTDNDSVYLKYKAYTFGYTDPVVIAALASPPYYKDLQHLEDAGDYRLGSSTSYEKSTSSSEGTTNSRTINVGAYINFELQAGCKYAKAVLEAEANYNHGWTEQMDKVKTVTQSIEYTTMGGQDSVVLVTVPMDVFVYDMYAPADETGSRYEVSDLRVVVPYEARSSVISAETYDTIREAYPHILPNISGEVFTHTIGYPSTYPDSPEGYEDSTTAEILSASEGNSSITSSISFEKEETSITSQSNSIDGKAGGGGVGGDDNHFEIKLTAGISGGYEQTAGQIKTTVTGSTYTGTVYGIPRSVGGDYRFGWRMLYYNYKNEIVNFPVVTYVVTGQNSPPALPDPAWAEEATGELGTKQLTIRWSPSLNDTAPSARADNKVLYELYLKSDTGDLLIDTPYTYNEAGGYYELIHKNLYAGQKYTYVIRSKTGPGVIPATVSVKSEPFDGYTLPDVSDASFTAQPQDILLRPFNDGTLTATFDEGKNPAQERRYEWQKKTGENVNDWTNVKELDGAADSYGDMDTGTLRLLTGNAKTHYGKDLEGEYRLVVGMKYQNYPSLIYFTSDSVTVSFRKYVTHVASGEFSYDEVQGVSHPDVQLARDPADIPKDSGELRGKVTFTIQHPDGSEAYVQDSLPASREKYYEYSTYYRFPEMTGTYTITHISYPGNDFYEPLESDVSFSFDYVRPPVITNEYLSNITDTSATLNFTSNESGECFLDIQSYGDNTYRKYLTNLPVQAGENSFTFDGMKGISKYQYRFDVISTETGAKRVGDYTSFMTSAGPNDKISFIVYGLKDGKPYYNFWKDRQFNPDQLPLTLRREDDETKSVTIEGMNGYDYAWMADKGRGKYKLYLGDTYTGLLIDHTSENKDMVFEEGNRHRVDLNVYTVDYSVVDKGTATGSSSSATYNGKAVADGDLILKLPGVPLVFTVQPPAGSAYNYYEWSGTGVSGQTSQTLTLDDIEGAIDVTCTVTSGNTPIAHTATLYVNKDDAPWAGHGKTFTLKDVWDETRTAAFSGAGGTLTAQAPNGTWAVYDGGTDTGERIVIQNGNGETGLEYYTVQFGVQDAGDASGSTISATCKDQKIESGAVLLRGSSLVITASGAGVSENGSYFYAWNDAQPNALTDDTLTIRQLTKPVNAQCTVTGVDIDFTPPTGTIALKSSSWKEFWNNVTFNLFFKETVNVEITAQDDREGPVTIEYYLSEAELSEQQAKEITNWTQGSEFSIDPKHKYIVYARLTDEAGNMAIINSSGIVVYTDSASLTPSIEYVKTSAQDVTARVILNGNTVDQIKNGENALTQGTDYTVEDNVITFHASYLDTLAASETPYTLTISYRPMGESYVEGEENQKPADTPLSLTVRKAEQDQLVIIGLNSTYTYGDDAFDIGASGGSGTGAVTFTSNNSAVAKVEGGTVTILKPGSFTITAQKAADENFERAFVTSDPITVNQAASALTLQAEPASYGEKVRLTAAVTGKGEIPTGTVTFKVDGAAGSAETVALADGKASVLAAGLEAGGHQLEAVYSGDAYYLGAEQQIEDYEMGKAEQQALSITNPGAKTYGDDSFTLQAAGGSGTGAVTWSSGNESVAKVDPASGKITITGAGRADITAKKAADNRYLAASAALTIIVEKAKLTVTAENKTREYGKANPALTYQITGFVNGESEAVLTKKPAASCSAGADAAVGTHPITVSGGEADNYAFVYADGTLTVTKAGQTPPSIQQGPKIDKTYGDDAFTLSVTGGSGTGAITWQSSDESVASVDQAGKVTVHKPGKAVVTVTKASDESYAEAQAFTAVTVGKAALTVTAADAQKQYGEDNPAFSYKMAGFVGGDTKEDLAALPVLAADADKTAGVGNYAIRLSGGEDDNYDYVLNNAELTITPRPITVKADDKEMTEGGNRPELTWTVTAGSLVNGDTLEGSLKAEGTDAGKYPITQDTPFANPNYAVTFQPGELTVLAKREDPSNPTPSEPTPGNPTPGNPTHPDNPQTGDGFPSWTLLLLLLSMGGIVLTFRSLWHRKER